jgi:hypothetical protein
MTTSTDAALTVDALCDRARQGLGTDAGSFEFLDALEVLTDSLTNEARIGPSDRAAVRNGLVGNLLTQGRVRQNVARHPEIEGLAVERPVFVIGLLRSGSTLLHNLLSEHPALRCPSLWELMTPAGPRDRDEQERAMDAAQSYVDELWRQAPALPKIHHIAARRADECHRLLVNTFESRIFWLRYRVPGYAAWLERRDLTAAYAHHRLQLQNVLWRVPGGVPVLKCPFHVWSLDALVRVYPDARFVHLHRDPAAVIASTCSLCAELRGARCESVDRTEIGPFWMERAARVLDDDRAIRESHLAGRPVLDVRYPDLVLDPIATAARVCEFIGVPMTEAVAARMSRYLADNGQHRHGVHRYTPEEFGISRGDIDDRFAGYRTAYDL